MTEPRLQGSDLYADVQRALGRKTLRFVHEHPGLTRSEIAERVHGHRKAVKRELGWLYANGYVERRDTPRPGVVVDGYYAREVDR